MDTVTCDSCKEILNTEEVILVDQNETKITPAIGLYLCKYGAIHFKCPSCASDTICSIRRKAA